MTVKAYIRRQRRLTITMGIWNVFTLVLYVMPVAVQFASDLLRIELSHNFLNVIMVICFNLNPFPHLILLIWRQSDINFAVAKLLPCIKKFRHVSAIDTFKVKSIKSRNA